MGMNPGLEIPYLVWSRTADKPTEANEPPTIKALEEEWLSNAEALRRRGMFRLVRGTSPQPLSAA